MMANRVAVLAREKVVPFARKTLSHLTLARRYSHFPCRRPSRGPAIPGLAKNLVPSDHGRVKPFPS